MAAGVNAGVAMNGKDYVKSGIVEHFDGIYSAPIEKLGVPGRWLRHMLLQWILSSTTVVTRLQASRRPWLDKLMRFLSFLGTEEFYTPIVVILEWVIDTRLARLFTILMGIGFYFTTFMKNILRLPRPPSPPAEVLETTYDWSLPSLHAIIGVLLPWYIFCYIAEHYNLMTWELLILVTITIFWSTSVSVSRLYLGVHSPADIICGIVPAVIIFAIYLYFDDHLDSFITSGSFVTIRVFIFYAFVLAIHPSAGSPTHSYGESVICNSVAFGFIMATTRTVSGGNYYHALMEQAQQVDHTGSQTGFTTQIFLLGCGRVLLGFPVVLLTRIIFKTITKFTVRQLCKAFNIECYSYAEYRKVTSQLNKHYTAGYQLTPIVIKEKMEDTAVEAINNPGSVTQNGHSHTNGVTTASTKEENDASSISRSAMLHNVSMPLDIDTPTKFVTYTMMAWVATEWLHIGFHHLGLHMIHQ